MTKNEPLTEERLLTIKVRAEAATPGPWRVKCEILEADECGNATAEMPYVSTEDKAICVLYGRGHDDANAHEDAAFIAAAREDVPALLAEVERLRTREDWLIKRIMKTEDERFLCPMPEGYKCESRVGVLCELESLKDREQCWRKAADMATRENPGNSGDFPESEQGEE